MRILMIATLNLSQANGGMVHFTSVAQEFRRAGHHVTAIVPSTGEAATDRQVREHYFDRVYFSSQTLARFIPLSKTSINSLLQSWAILLQNPRDYDWVYLRSHLLSALTLLVLRARGFQRIMAEHNGWFQDELRFMGVPAFCREGVKQLQVLDARLATLVIAVVAGIKDKLVAQGIDPGKLLVIGNGADVDLFHPRPREQSLQQYYLNPDYFYLGLIGDLEPWKGAEVAIRAMPLIWEHYPQTQLLVVGSGRQLQYLQTTYRDWEKVRFLNAVPYLESNAYINCFDLALLPLLEFSAIGFSPIKLYAYAAAGRPILSAKFRGIETAVTAGFTVVHQSGNAADLAAQAIALMDNPAKLQQMGDLARHYAEQHYSWQLIGEKILHSMSSRSGN